jgi:hypothetical protein
MAAKDTSTSQSLGQDMNMVVGVAATGGKETVTARKAGGITDMQLPISPRLVPLQRALQNLAKAINLALQSDFLETDLDTIYKGARVRKGQVQILHHDYIGLGDGLFASLGKGMKSFQLTLRGPDPASPEGREWFAKHGGGSIRGIFNLIGRKMNFIQEYEDKVPVFVEQMLDRLEAAKMIRGWDRSEWVITTSLVGLDVTIAPNVESKPAPSPS